MGFWLKTCFEGVSFILVQSPGGLTSSVYVLHMTREHVVILEAQGKGPQSCTLQYILGISYFPSVLFLVLPYFRTRVSFSHKEEMKAGILSLLPLHLFWLFMECSNLPAMELTGLKKFTFIFCPYISQIAF